MDRLFRLFLKTPEDMNVFRRMAGENFGVYKREYALAALSLIVISVTTFGSAWLIGPIVKDVFLGENMDQAVTLSAAVVVIFITRGVATYFQTILLQRIGNNLVARYQRRLFRHILDLDVGFFANHHSAALVSRVNTNIMRVRNLLNTIVLGYVRDMVTLIGLVAVMLWRAPLLTLGIAIVGPITLYIMSRYARRIKRIARQEVELASQVSASMQEAAHGITVVKAFTMEEQMRRRVDALTSEAELRANKIARIMARTAPLMETLGGFAIAAVILYGGWRVINFGAEPSDLTSFVVALLMAYEPAKKLARIRVTLERSLTNARMLYEILDTQPKQAIAVEAQPLLISGGRIAFEDVTFRYREDKTIKEKGVPAILKAPPVIDGMSFIAEAGKTTALVGPSGGGKSTIIALIQRFYDPENGRITIDGIDSLTVSIHELRSHIAYVSQDPILFQGTVRENLRYARPDATDEQIETAAKSAQAHDFIMELPKGYDTPLDENASNLSGGQRQRLSIARAIVRNAPILLLDEATSALDNESEALVQQALEGLMKNRTTIVIAHRLSTIADADKILVIDGGRVVDEGTHEELLAQKGGVYQRLHGIAKG